MPTISIPKEARDLISAEFIYYKQVMAKRYGRKLIDSDPEVSFFQTSLENSSGEQYIEVLCEAIRWNLIWRLTYYSQTRDAAAAFAANTASTIEYAGRRAAQAASSALQAGAVSAMNAAQAGAYMAFDAAQQGGNRFLNAAQQSAWSFAQSVSGYFWGQQAPMITDDPSTLPSPPKSNFCNHNPTLNHSPNFNPPSPLSSYTPNTRLSYELLQKATAASPANFEIIPSSPTIGAQVPNGQLPHSPQQSHHSPHSYRDLGPLSDWDCTNTPVASPGHQIPASTDPRIFLFNGLIRIARQMFYNVFISKIMSASIMQYLHTYIVKHDGQRGFVTSTLFLPPEIETHIEKLYRLGRRTDITAYVPDEIISETATVDAAAAAGLAAPTPSVITAAGPYPSRFF